MTDFQSSRVDNHSTLNAERCIVELQRGREILLENGNQACTVQLVETLDEATLHQVEAIGPYQLVLSHNRAQALGYEHSADAAILNPPRSANLVTIKSLAGLMQRQSVTTQQLDWQTEPDVSAVAALRLVQQSAVLPALLRYDTPVRPRGIMALTINEAFHYQANTASLIEMSCGEVPLATADQTTLRVFREAHGSAEHVAMIIGHPDPSKPVDVRVHSSCFTGDILGSLKCDCGEQLQGAIAGMARSGGGVLLYVSQEGRGIGLASKLRAYQLQAEGLDTIEANQYLGFKADARRYQAAAAMLQAMKIRQIRLITNNPEKINALRAEGIDVVARLPSVATVNVHNARYLETKRQRSGHLSMESVG